MSTEKAFVPRLGSTWANTSNAAQVIALGDTPLVSQEQASTLYDPGDPFKAFVLQSQLRRRAGMLSFVERSQFYVRIC